MQMLYYNYHHNNNHYLSLILIWCFCRHCLVDTDASSHYSASTLHVTTQNDSRNSNSNDDYNSNAIPKDVFVENVSSSTNDAAEHSSMSPVVSSEVNNMMIHVIKRTGEEQVASEDKIQARLRHLCHDLDSNYISADLVSEKVMRGMYPGASTAEVDALIAETAASMSTIHPDYATVAARVIATRMHKTTNALFSDAMLRLHKAVDPKTGEKCGFICKNLVELIGRRRKEIDERIEKSRDFELTYFGLKTLQRSYLLREHSEGEHVEIPQYMLMRVALGIHCSIPAETQEDEDMNLSAAFETYDMMSRGFFTHASPTLFHSGTTHPQLSSCFLVQMSEDSINGIYDTLKRCAVISKSAGGIGLSVHNIRARGTHIKGTRGVSNGLIPMLRCFDVTSRYVDQGGGKRPGAFAVYLEPWHADIFDVLNLKKNHGKEEQRARDLFYGLWIPDLFMKRVEEDGYWSLMCPHQCPGLFNSHGKDFENLYTKYEDEGRAVRSIRARELWSAILDAQIETGTPYLLYKDACNSKSNQQNLGTIQCSNLCTEIIQYTDPEEVAVCNLASLCLPKFVVSSRGKYGSINPDATSSDCAYFDHAALHKATKIVTRNLNKIIDINMYPVDGAKTSNMRHRPIGIGVSGLADSFIRLGLPFASDEAKELNEAIFETIYHAALEASVELAAEKGAYETFDGSPASKGILQFNLWGVNDEETPSHRWNPEAFRRLNHKYGTNNCAHDWEGLRKKIMSTGLRNSLLVAPMPTASTSQILGVNECFEPFVSNLYLRRVKAGEFILANNHLLQDLTDRGLWTPQVRNQLMRDGGSVANIACIPDRLKELYKTVWEIKMKDVIDMAADRGRFIDQSQSLNLFIAEPTADKLTAMHFYAWKKGLKTGMYYLRTRPAVNAIQYTVEKNDNNDDDLEGNTYRVNLPTETDENVCLSCQV